VKRPPILLLCGLFAACSNPAPQADTDTDTDGGEGSGTAPVPSTTGEPEGDAEPWAAGDRLQPIVHSDGADQAHLVGWHDSELDLDCTFVETTDGFACLPVAGFDGTVFADPGCSSPAAAVTDCISPPSYGTLAYPGCGPATVMQTADAIDAVYAIDTSGQCSALPNTQGLQLEPVALTTFVGATRTLRDFGGPLGRWEFTADDGAIQWAGPADVEQAQTCTPVTHDGTTHCLTGPVAVADPRFHLDAACTSNDIAYTLGTQSCAPPRFAQDRRDVPFAIAEDVATSAIRESAADDCVTWDGRLPDIEFFRVRPFEAADAPAVTHAPEGDTRLILRTPASNDGDPLSQGTWFDTELNVDCTFSPTDGGLCTPVNVKTISMFADANCSVPLSRGEDPAEGWHTLQTSVSEECTRTQLGIGRITQPYAGDVYLLSGGDCTVLPTPDPYGPFHTLEVLPLASLPMLTEIR